MKDTSFCFIYGHQAFKYFKNGRTPIPEFEGTLYLLYAYFVELRMMGVWV